MINQNYLKNFVRDSISCAGLGILGNIVYNTFSDSQINTKELIEYASFWLAVETIPIINLSLRLYLDRQKRLEDKL